MIDPQLDLTTLRKRDLFIRKIRHFFHTQKQQIFEVETPILSNAASIDLQIDLIGIEEDNVKYFCVSSPEYHMKRLLAAGSGDIFQISKAFRASEKGDLHNREFTILEWYRLNWNYLDLMGEVELLISTLLGCKSAQKVKYRDLFLKELQIDPFLEISQEDFLNICNHYEICLSESFLIETDQDNMLNLLMGALIEPKLGIEYPVFVYDYPKSQAALAIENEDGLSAARFELYFKGIELCNGFQELSDPKVQLERLLSENKKREESGKAGYPIDYNFLSALNHGLPNCSGVAVGIDRIFMIDENLTSIKQAVSFHSENS